MVRAWYMDTDTTIDQRLEHHKQPPEFIDIEDVNKLTGVEYFKINLLSINEDEELEKLKKERGYSYEDELTCSKECLENYDEKLKTFYKEHLHTDEEIRLILEGSGYFDVRDKNDNWIRIEVVSGDMLILPGGIYHRFTLDSKNYLKAKRFFIGKPVWTAYNRLDESDKMECRQNYIKTMKVGN